MIVVSMVIEKTKKTLEQYEDCDVKEPARTSSL